MIGCLVSRSAVVAILLLVVASCRCAAGVNTLQPKEGCAGKCGDVEIPFPFGIGDGCYFTGPFGDEDGYRVECDSSSGLPKARLPILGSAGDVIISINLEDHTIRVSSRIAYDCYDTFGGTIPFTNPNMTYIQSASDVPFAIAGSSNKLVTIGCNTIARLWDASLNFTTFGCTAYCSDSVPAHETDWTCSGVGCCEASFPGSISYPSISLHKSSTHNPPTQDYMDYPCSYAFVAELGSYNLSTSNMSATAKDCHDARLPLLYTWYMYAYNSTSSCPATGDPGVICGSNTQFQCVLGDFSPQYHCQCLEGYAGNPYLQHGCQDINECEDETLNDCQRSDYCVNTKGGYDCRCPHGQSGNATTTTPCNLLPATEKLVLNKTKLILGVSICTGSTIGFIILYCMYKLINMKMKKKKRENNFKRNGGLLLQQQISANTDGLDRTKVFNRGELEKATDNFNDNRILGRGGQGTVYKGMLVDGTIVAVKKSSKVGESQLGQFINEVVILSQINHRNVVKLFGCCLETEVPLLVYEFLPNGTLYQHIHHPRDDFHLTWKVRFQIAVECVGAIAYLHSSCSSPIYHRDIKSSNILLDDKYKAKIADFGTSRSISLDKTHVTTCVQGTFGYLDPEFFRSHQFSEKSDVYSFGVVLLELLTSKKPIFTNTCGEPKGLATEFLQIVEINPIQLRDILDPQVLQNCSEEEVAALAKLIERCLSLNGKQRPTMREVAMTLEMIKKQHHEEDAPATADGITRQEGINGDSSLNISSFYDSINSQPPSFDCV